MSKVLHSRLIHALLAVLLTAGLLLPLLAILQDSPADPMLLLLAAGIILLFECFSINRVSAWAGGGILLAALLVWLFAAGGLVTVSDAVLALSLRFSGVSAALPLAGASVPLLLTAVITLVSCFATLRGASILPVSLLCLSMILLIYLSPAEHVLPLFLPALGALLLMLFTDRFPETSVLSVLPLAALLVAAAFLLSGVGPESKTLQKKADEIRQAVLDRLFFTEPRDVFSLSSEGYYPEGQDQLGGKPSPDENPVMQVSAPRPVYLRGVILNEYTGRSWHNTAGGRRNLWQSPRLAAQRSLLFDEDLPARNVRNSLCDPVTVSVRMLSDSASTLFVPQRVRELVPGAELVPYFSDSSEIFITRNLRSGDTYSVSAPLFQAGDPGLGTLIEVCSTLEDPQYDRMLENYTRLPSHLEEPVYALARETASVAFSPYDRALALQAWLGRNFRYTLDVDPQPGDVDFVTRFLLDTREGYCTYFASAMTVLCRMIGLPARYVEGYLARPDENGQAVVTGRSAHAWTEVYFKGFGWLTFDATPGQSGNAGQSDPMPEPSPSPTPEPTPEPVPESSDPPENNPPSPSPDPASSPQDVPHHPAGFPWLWLLLLLIPLLLALRIRLTSPAFLDRRAKSDERRFDIWIREVTSLLRAENYTRRPGETLMAFGRRVDADARFSVALSPVEECHSLIRYSRSAPCETDISLVRDTSILLKSELSRPARLRYLFTRMFTRHALSASGSKEKKR